jgi:hypothetical protein
MHHKILNNNKLQTNFIPISEDKDTEIFYIINNLCKLYNIIMIKYMQNYNIKQKYYSNNTMLKALQ